MCACVCKCVCKCVGARICIRMRRRGCALGRQRTCLCALVGTDGCMHTGSTVGCCSRPKQTVTQTNRIRTRTHAYTHARTHTHTQSRGLVSAQTDSHTDKHAYAHVQCIHAYTHTVTRSSLDPNRQLRRQTGIHTRTHAYPHTDTRTQSRGLVSAQTGSYADTQAYAHAHMHTHTHTHGHVVSSCMYSNHTLSFGTKANPGAHFVQEEGVSGSHSMQWTSSSHSPSAHHPVVQLGALGSVGGGSRNPRVGADRSVRVCACA